MKKRIVSALLCLCMAMTLLPATALAAGATQISHVDIVIELPKAGESNDSFEYMPKVKSIKSGSIDLLAKGANIMESSWSGDDVVSDDGESYSFRGGATYLVDMQLDLGSSGYCAKYTTVGGETVATPDTFSVTVNGVPATINICTPPPIIPPSKSA